MSEYKALRSFLETYKIFQYFKYNHKEIEPESYDKINQMYDKFVDNLRILYFDGLFDTQVVDDIWDKFHNYVHGYNIEKDKIEKELEKYYMRDALQNFISNYIDVFLKEQFMEEAKDER